MLNNEKITKIIARRYMAAIFDGSAFRDSMFCGIYRI